MEFNIRPWEPADLQSLVKYANNINVAQYLTDQFPFPYTEDAGRAFIAFANQDKPIRIFAIELDNEAVGGIGIHPQTDVFRKNAELGYWLGEPFWGKGIMSEAIRRVLNTAFTNYDINRVFARPFGSNIGSQKILEKNHFKLEARFEQVLFKNGGYLDELVYAIRRADWERFDY